MRKLRKLSNLLITWHTEEHNAEEDDAGEHGINERERVGLRANGANRVNEVDGVNGV